MAPKNKSFTADIQGLTNPALAYVSTPTTDTAGAGMAETASTSEPTPKKRTTSNREKKTRQVTFKTYPSVWERVQRYTEKTGDNPQNFLTRLLIETLNKLEAEENK